MIKNIIIIIIGAALAYAGYSFWNKNMAVKQSASSNPMAGKPMEVTTIIIKTQEVDTIKELPGRVSAYKISAVRPQVQGILRERLFEEGTIVNEGDQLYQIDPTLYQIAYDSAKQNLKTLRAKRDRYQNLLKEDAVSKQEFDDANAAFATAEANLKQAETNLEYTKVKAPISGFIGKSNVTEGVLLTANQTDVLTTITQLDPIYVDMVQPTREALNQKDSDDEIEVTLKMDNPNYKNSGKLKLTEVFADEATDSVRLRSLFSNPDKKLIPGMYVTALLHFKPYQAITVPQRCSVRAPGGVLMVWVVEDGMAKSRIIKANKISGDNWIVEDGLKEGDMVIYEGYQKLADGAKVNPVSLEKNQNGEVKK